MHAEIKSYGRTEKSVAFCTSLPTSQNARTFLSIANHCFVFLAASPLSDTHGTCEGIFFP